MFYGLFGERPNRNGFSLVLFIAAATLTCSVNCHPTDFKDAAKAANEEESSFAFINQETLTGLENKIIIAIKLNFGNKGSLDWIHLDAISRELRKEIVKYLNSKYKTTTKANTAAAPMVAVLREFLEAVAGTTELKMMENTIASVEHKTSEPLTKTAADMNPYRHRRSLRDVACALLFKNMNITNFTEEDIKIVVTEEGKVSFFLNITGNAIEIGDCLFEVISSLNMKGILNDTTNGTVLEIYHGFPNTTMQQLVKLPGYPVWLPIIITILVLLAIFIAICYWKAKNKKVADKAPSKTSDGQKKLQPSKSKPLEAQRVHPTTPANQGPIIIDDDCGYIVPLEQMMSVDR